MSIFAQVKEKITQYIDVYIKLAKISFIEGTSNILSYFMFAFICLFLIFCVVLFMGFGMVEVFTAIGFTRLSALLMVLGLYFVTLILVLLLRGKITRYFAGGFIKLMTGGSKDDEEDDD